MRALDGLAAVIMFWLGAGLFVGLGWLISLAATAFPEWTMIGGMFVVVSLVIFTKAATS